MRRGPLLAATAVTLGLVSACGPRTTPNEPPHALLAPLGLDAPARVELRQLEARPRLALVARDGDPAPAVVVAVATEVGPAGTVGLAALVEARLQAGGFAVESRAGRDAFYVRWPGADSRLPAFFAALRSAFETPVDPRADDTRRAAEHIASLRRHALDGPELVPIVACTGALGGAIGELSLDPTNAAGAAQLDALRQAALHAGRAAIGVVGSPAFTGAALRAMEQAPGFRLDTPPQDPPPAGDSLGVYTRVSGPTTRLSMALRTSSATAAVSAAERLGEPSSPLAARLRALEPPYRLTEISGTARPRGGCVAVTMEPANGTLDASPSRGAALAAVIARREIETELAEPDDPLEAARQVLLAPEAVEAASRAAWWALVSPVPPSPARAAFAFGLPAERTARPADLAKLRLELTSAVQQATAAIVPDLERRSAIERGQGELWVLLGSPCGVASESATDAGITALGALLAAGEGAAGVTLEPWLRAEGMGILAHAPALGSGQALADAARRVADAAARALVAPPLDAPSVERARAAALVQLDAAWGPRTVVASAFADALSPEHPSWALPLGPWARVSTHSAEAVAERWRRLVAGPLRLVVLANGDPSQVALASASVERWLIPPAGKGTPCPAWTAAAPRPGKQRRALPKGAEAQLLVALPAPARGAAGHDAAEQLAFALEGADGALADALRNAGVAARGSVRFVAAPAAAIVFDVRVAALGADAAFAALDGLLGALARGELAMSTLTRGAEAAAALDVRARLHPRARIEALWSSATPARTRLSPEALRATAMALAAEERRIVVEGRPE